MKIERILSPVDFSEDSAVGLAQAAELANRFGAELIVLNVVPTNQAEAMVFLPGNPWEKIEEETGKDLESFVWEHVPSAVRKGLSIRPVVSAGAPISEIVRVADEENVDIIVIATHGRTGVKHAFMGSVAETVVRLSRKPVWTVRKEAFAFERP